MFKSHLVFIIAVVSGFLLTLQLITLQIIVRKSQPEANPTWAMLYAVTNTAASNSIPLFLVDPFLLRQIRNKTIKSFPSYCKILCFGHKITHLATLNQFATHLHLSKLVTTLRNKGYTVLEFSEDDPNLLHHNLHVAMPMHLLILNEKVDKLVSHVVHIVVFYERIASKYWWHGQLTLTENDMRLLHRQGMRRSLFKTSEEFSIYDKTELHVMLIDGLILSLPHPMDPFLAPAESVRFIECNRTRAKEFHAKYGADDGEEATIFKNKALRLLAKATKLLNEMAIPFWLSSGTCLGYCRQCDFIPHGRDVDIGILATDFKPDLIDVFMTNDLPILHSFGKLEDSYELSFRDGNIKLDIFFFYVEDDRVWNGGTDDKTGQKFKYSFRNFKLCWTEFYDLKVRIPCETNEYIQDNYGPRWFELIKEWDWKSSPPNVRPNGRWQASEWNNVIKSYPTPDLF